MSRTSGRIAMLLSLALLLASALACGRVGGEARGTEAGTLAEPAGEQYPPQKPSRYLGKFVYQQHCGSCHGSIGPALQVPGYIAPAEVMAERGPAGAPPAAESDPNPFYPEVVGPYNDLYDYAWFQQNPPVQFANYTDRGRAPLASKTYGELFELLNEPHGREGDIKDFGALLSSRERWAVVYYISNMGLDNGKDNWAATWDQQIALRKNIYGTHCSICHGGVGRGDGPEGNALIPKPMNFNELEWAVGARATYPVTDDYLYDIIAKGKIEPGSNRQWTGMPFWGDQLREEDIWGLVEYIRSLTYTE